MYSYSVLYIYCVLTVYIYSTVYCIYTVYSLGRAEARARQADTATRAGGRYLKESMARVREGSCEGEVF